MNDDAPNVSRETGDTAPLFPEPPNSTDEQIESALNVLHESGVNLRPFASEEEHRHACEVRHVISLPTKEARAEYLAGVSKQRGDECAARLRADVLRLWEEKTK